MDETTIPDERLELVFTCCHPALALDAQVALTLRTLGGLAHRGDRPRVPRPGGDDGEAARPREAEDQDGRDPVPRPAGAPAPRPSRRRARGRLPDLQRGLRRPGRPRDGGDPARPRARRADAGRGRGARPARADAPERRAPRRALRRRRHRPSRTSRTGRSGTPARSPRDAPRSIARSPSAAAGRTCCRRRSPRCTSTSLPTGRGSRPSTASSRVSPARRSSSSTGPSRSPRRATSRQRSLCVDGLELDRYHYLHATRADLLRRLEPDRRGPRRIRACARARPLRARAPVPRAPAGGPRMTDLTRTREQRTADTIVRLRQARPDGTSLAVSRTIRGCRRITRRRSPSGPRSSRPGCS